MRSAVELYTQVFIILNLDMLVSTVKLQDQSCKTGDLYPHEDDYAKFYMCNETVKVLVDCPFGLIFNQLLDGCDYMSESFPIKSFLKIPVKPKNTTEVVKEKTYVTKSLNSKKNNKKQKAKAGTTQASFTFDENNHLKIPKSAQNIKQPKGGQTKTDPNKKLLMKTTNRMSTFTPIPNKNLSKYRNEIVKPVTMAMPVVTLNGNKGMKKMKVLKKTQKEEKSKTKFISKLKPKSVMKNKKKPNVSLTNIPKEKPNIPKFNMIDNMYD